MNATAISMNKFYCDLVFADPINHYCYNSDYYNFEKYEYFKIQNEGHQNAVQAKERIQSYLRDMQLPGYEKLLSFSCRQQQN
jgi:hypothetical protein